MLTANHAGVKCLRKSAGQNEKSHSDSGRTPYAVRNSFLFHKHISGGLIREEEKVVYES